MAPIKQEQAAGPISILAIIKGLLAALIIIILSSAVLGVIYHTTALAEKTLPLTTNILFYASVFLGSVYAARDAGFKGLWHGIGAALIIFLSCWFFAGTILHLQAGSMALVNRLVISLIAGAVGGVLGVGLNK